MDKAINLTDKNLYLAELDKVHKKLKLRNALEKQQQAGLIFLDFIFARNKVCRILASLISKQKYSPYNPKSQKLHFKNKKIIVCDYTITDKIVQGVLFKHFSKAQERYLSDNVYSYLKNRNALQAVEAFSSYLKNKKSVESIYVFSADIFSYSDAIPVDETSPLWRRINELGLEEKINVNYTYILSLIKNILRPILFTKENYPYQNIVGIPMGSPFALLANNIYLKPIDDALLTIPGLFYARYCDQFIFAHTDSMAYQHAETALVFALTNLKLSLNNQKIKRIQLTANENVRAVAENIKTTNQIELLGFNINKNGDVSVNKNVVRSLMRNIFIRLHNCSKLLTAADLDVKGKALCAAVNTMLNPTHELCDPLLKQLMSATADKKILKELDDKICLKIVELCSGVDAKNALGIIPYRKIYNEWGLIKCHQ